MHELLPMLVLIQVLVEYEEIVVYRHDLSSRRQ
jgi:hypothetical protein